MSTDQLAQRLTDCVSKKLGVPVTFSHWIKRSTGDVPVFLVPDNQIDLAVSLGLTVKHKSLTHRSNQP